jgi:hypothetical protein
LPLFKQKFNKMNKNLWNLRTKLGDQARKYIRYIWKLLDL